MIPIKFLERDNKTKLVPASISGFLERKINFSSKRVIVITVIISLQFKKFGLEKVVEDSNNENLKMIENKSGNPEILKK